MKLTDQELFTIIWQKQLRKVASDVLVRYCGGSVGVIEADDHSYEFCSQIARVNAGGLTDLLSPATIKRRIKGLVEKGWLKPTRKNDLGHTMIDGREAREAFEAARTWWLNKGIPTGYYTLEDGRQGSNTIEAPKNLQAMIDECREYLIESQARPKTD